MTPWWTDDSPRVQTLLFSWNGSSSVLGTMREVEGIERLSRRASKGPSCEMAWHAWLVRPTEPGCPCVWKRVRTGAGWPWA